MLRSGLSLLPCPLAMPLTLPYPSSCSHDRLTRSLDLNLLAPQAGEARMGLGAPVTQYSVGPPAD